MDALLNHNITNASTSNLTYLLRKLFNVGEFVAFTLIFSIQTCPIIARVGLDHQHNLDAFPEIKFQSTSCTGEMMILELQSEFILTGR